MDERYARIYQGVIKPELAPERRARFEPWHKPRKHYIRLSQWSECTLNLIDRLGLGNHSELSYFGLPGEDMLDVRLLLETVCKQRRIAIKYLGIDNRLKSPILNLSRSEVNDSGLIHESSVVISDRFEELANDGTMIAEYVDRHAPFDIINLDLCDSITNKPKEGRIPNLQALKRVCDVQAERRGSRPWLLFVTSRIVPGELDEGTRRRLFKQLLDNVEANGIFATELKRVLRLAREDINGLIRASNDRISKTWVDSYNLALGKWLLGYMNSSGPGTSVDLLKCGGYRVFGNECDMVSLAFQFQSARIERTDTSGLTAPDIASDILTDEQQLACRFIESASLFEDVDSLLEKSDGLKRAMAEQTAQLLESVRYDRDAYLKWAMET